MGAKNMEQKDSLLGPRHRSLLYSNYGQLYLRPKDAGTARAMLNRVPTIDHRAPIHRDVTLFVELNGFFSSIFRFEKK